LDVHVGVPLCPVDRLRVFGHILMHDYFFDDARPLRGYPKSLYSANIQ
jgi:hypothetical protein